MNQTISKKKQPFFSTIFTVSSHEPYVIPKKYEGKFPNDRWAYWENGCGGLMPESNALTISAKQMIEEGWTPVTKFYYFGWIGNIKFDVLTPSRTTNKMQLGLVTVDKKIYNTVQCGECKGISEEVAIEFTNNKDKYLGTVIEVECNGVFEATGKLRHPRYLRDRPDKSFDQCTWENHIEG